MSSTLGRGRKQGLLYLLLLLLRLGNTRSVVTTYAVAVFLTSLTPGRYRYHACVRTYTRLHRRLRNAIGYEDLLRTPAAMPAQKARAPDLDRHAIYFNYTRRPRWGWGKYVVSDKQYVD